jgi:hypothetical protein
MNNMQSSSPILYNVELSKDNWSLKGKKGREKILQLPWDQHMLVQTLLHFCSPWNERKTGGSAEEQAR